ncbi:MAG: hypothetical protein QM764_02385 [Chitinophagaceae bacterium]
MVTAREAISHAKTAITNFYTTMETSDFLLEEVELSDDNSHWTITFSMPDKNPTEASFARDLLGNARKYKIIIIDATNGKFKAMKIRKL